MELRECLYESFGGCFGPVIGGVCSAHVDDRQIEYLLLFPPDAGMNG